MCTVDELQRLNDKLDLADPAGAEFNVQLIGRNLAFNPAFDRGNFIE